MVHIPDAVFIARAMIATYGEQALAAALDRSKLNELAGDPEAAAMWRLVADAMRELPESANRARAQV